MKIKNNSNVNNVLAIGGKGCAGVIGKLPAVWEGKINSGEAVQIAWAKFNQFASRDTLIGLHGIGKPMADVHYSLACYDAGCYVTGQGSSVQFWTLENALKKGIVKKVSFIGERNGKFDAYVPAKWDMATKLPHYLYVPSIPSKRIEPRTIDGGKNSAVADHVRLANEASKPASKPAAPSKPAPVVKPAKTGKSAPKAAVKSKGK